MHRYMLFITDSVNQKEEAQQASPGLLARVFSHYNSMKKVQQISNEFGMEYKDPALLEVNKEVFQYFSARLEFDVQNYTARIHPVKEEGRIILFVSYAEFKTYIADICTVTQITLSEQQEKLNKLEIFNEFVTSIRDAFKDAK